MVKPIDKVMIVRVVALLVALLNQGLVTFGKSPLPFDEGLFEQFVSLLFLGGTAIWATWKNNSFTKEAREADEYLKELKSNK